MPECEIAENCLELGVKSYKEVSQRGSKSSTILRQLACASVGVSPYVARSRVLKESAYCACCFAHPSLWFFSSFALRIHRQFAYGRMWNQPRSIIESPALHFVQEYLRVGIMMVRAPDDWIFSAFNFFCIPGYDDGCANKWNLVNRARHARSPSSFDAAVRAPGCVLDANGQRQGTCLLRHLPRVAELARSLRLELGERLVVADITTLHNRPVALLNDLVARMGLSPFNASLEQLLHAGVNTAARRGMRCAH